MYIPTELTSEIAEAGIQRICNCIDCKGRCMECIIEAMSFEFSKLMEQKHNGGKNNG